MDGATSDVYDASNENPPVGKGARAVTEGFLVKMGHRVPLIVLVCATLLFSIPALAQTHLNPLWSLAPQSRMYLPLDTDVMLGRTPFYRSLAYSPLSNHVYIVSRNQNAQTGFSINVLDATTGADLYKLSTNGITPLPTPANSIILIAIGVAEDGAIYAANMAYSGGAIPAIYKLYRWANASSNTDPVLVFSGEPSGSASVLRWGDTMAVRGAGTNTEVMIDQASTLAILRPTDATLINFTPTSWVISNVTATSVGRTVLFGTNNTVWQKRYGYNLFESSFDFSATNTTFLYLNPSIPGTFGQLGLDLTNHLMAVIIYSFNASTPDSLDLYDVSDFDNPVLMESHPFPTTEKPNSTGIGQVVFSNGRIYALNGNNGIMALTVGIRGPAITTQPLSVFCQAGENATFSVTANGQPPLHYQWHGGTGILANATNSSLTITNAQADASYYVVVSNSYGIVTSQSAQLKILVDYTTAIPTPLSPTAEPPQPRQPNQHNLVVVTHGWHNLLLSPLDMDTPQWVYDLTNSIGSHLPDSSWTVFALGWNGLSGAAQFFPATAAKRAEIIGQKFGRGISAQGWSHVHFIGHSAGAVLIQAAAEELIANSPSPVEIHTTFLDPYDWSFFGGPARFGAGSAWSDHYFESDITGPLTGGQLDNSYNVNISGLDPHTFGAHEWAYEFYQKTITGYPFDLNEGRGFPLSKEMGNWDYAINTYHRGDPPYLLGPSIEKLLASSSVPIQHNPNLVVSALSSLWNGTVYLTYNGFDLFTSLISPSPSRTDGSPVWLSLGITVTNRINFVKFDARFTSATNAAGLLTVYWNTNEIGVADETVTTPGLQNYSFALPATYSSGNYVLGFRLDSFTNIVSSISITNISLGFAGLTNPITLGISRASGSNQLTLTGPSNYNYLVQSSSNLVDWIPAAIVPNTNGTEVFSDPAATNYSRRFYRAVSP